MYIVQAKGILICELATTQIFQAILYQLFNFSFNSIILDNPLLARNSLLKFLLSSTTGSQKSRIFVVHIFLRTDN